MFRNEKLAQALGIADQLPSLEHRDKSVCAARRYVSMLRISDYLLDLNDLRAYGKAEIWDDEERQIQMEWEIDEIDHECIAVHETSTFIVDTRLDCSVLYFEGGYCCNLGEFWSVSSAKAFCESMVWLFAQQEQPETGFLT